ncbi:MAG: ABC transporter substrate-binding protein [Patescibacteria group bacterium]|nr:ABC transporter substrate-binding protein [Patescibacteria group bacterium]
MKNRKIAWLIGLALVVIIIVIVTQASRPSDPELTKIGLVMPLSGELAAFGDNVLHGVEIALAQSGLDSSTVELVPEDTAGFTTSGALSAFRKVVEQDQVDVVIGPFGPAQTLTIAPTLDPDSGPTVISASNCDDRFQDYPTVFCIYPGLTDQVEHAIDFMKSQGWKKIYFFTENSEFGLLVEDILEEHSDEITLLGVEKIVPNQTKDIRTLVAKMIAAKPDVVYTMLSPTEGFITLRQYPILSKGTPLYISSDVNKDQLKDLFGEEAEEIYFAARLSEDYNPDFVRTFRESYDADPDYFAALGHSATTLLLDTLKENRFNMSDLIEDIIGASSPDAAVDGFRFKPNRTVHVPLHSYEFKGGEFVEIK